MAFYVFVSGKAPQQYAVAADPSAPSLPLDLEPWAFRRFEPTRQRVDDIDRDKAEDDIAAQGFHLCRDVILSWFPNRPSLP